MYNVLDFYPEIKPLVTDHDLEILENHAATSTPAATEKSIAKAEATGQIAGKDFGYYCLGDSDAGVTLVVPGEFGMKTEPWVVSRAQAIAKLCAPDVHLILMPNNGLNLTQTDRRKLHHGNPSPYVDRIMAATQQAKGVVIGYGMSHGAAILSAAAARADSPFSALGLLEAPNVTNRSLPALGRAFLQSGKHLESNIRLNGQGEVLDAHIASLHDARGTARWIAHLLGPNNVATASYLSGSAFTSNLAIAASRAQIVNAWGSRSLVSKGMADAILAAQLATKPNYREYIFTGDLADHSITNVYLMGVLARQALQNQQNL